MRGLQAGPGDRHDELSRINKRHAAASPTHALTGLKKRLDKHVPKHAAHVASKSVGLVAVLGRNTVVGRGRRSGGLRVVVLDEECARSDSK